MSRKEEKTKNRIISLEKELEKINTDGVKTIDIMKKLLWENEDLYKLNQVIGPAKNNVKILYGYFYQNSKNYSINGFKEEYYFFSKN